MAKRLLLLVVLFFLIWRTFLSYLLWSGRDTPPVTDDSYVYMSNIESVRTCPTLIFCKNNLYGLNAALAYDRLAYRLPLGMFARLLGISSLNMFQISFFLGNFFLLASLYVFLTSLNPPRLIKAMCLLTLAFFNGNGLYHGFYWLVPSAYALGLFLLTFSVIIRSTKNAFWYLLIFIPVGIFTHLLYLYLLVIPIVYCFILSCLNRKIYYSILIKSLIALVIASISYFPVELYLQRVSKGYSYGVLNSYQSFVTSSSQKSPDRASLRQTSQLFQSLDSIADYYFKPIFSVPIVGFAFLALIGILAVRKKNKILSIYLSALVFTLISSISLFGYRSLLLFWPVTLILITWGIWEYIPSLLKFRVLASILTLTYLGLISLFGIYSIIFTLILNEDHTWDVDPRAESFIRANISPQDPVYYVEKIPESYFGATSIYHYLNQTLDPQVACYYIASFPNPKTKISRFDRLMGGLIAGLDQTSQAAYPDSIGEFDHFRTLGSLHIYKKDSCLK